MEQTTLLMLVVVCPSVKSVNKIVIEMERARKVLRTKEKTTFAFICFSIFQTTRHQQQFSNKRGLLLYFQYCTNLGPCVLHLLKLLHILVMYNKHYRFVLSLYITATQIKCKQIINIWPIRFVSTMSVVLVLTIK